MQNIKLINKNNLINNVKTCQNVFKNICIMVKADAYGHGMQNIVKLLKNKIKYFGVANITEALKAKKLCDNKILIVGKSINFTSIIKNDISFTVDGLEEINKINKICFKLKKQARIHIAINTGMNRIGVKTLQEFKQILSVVKRSKNIILEGIFTHCFDADYKKTNFNSQMIVFEKFVSLIEDKSVLVHIGGSYVLKQQIPKFANMVRVGFFAYGYGMNKLKPVMSIKSKIVKVINVNAGEFVGYGKNEIKQNRIIAVVPVGYADGFCRQASNKYCVNVNGHNCRICGNICMDMFMVDITNVSCKVGDTVTVFSNAYKLANITNTSPYEILTNFQKLRGKSLIV